ncbi:hypothetical protein U1Q18_005601 [Sarracenia purpurea var. burkii]
MHGWLQIMVVAAAAAVGVLVIVLFLWRCFSSSKQHKDLDAVIGERTESTVRTGIPKPHHPSLPQHDDLDFRRRTNYYVFRREASTKPPFSWSDHPSLVTDAVENGWSRFAFANPYTSSPSIRSTRSTLLGACAVGDRRETEVEIGWEVSQGSADFIQKIRLNSGLRKMNSSHSSSMAAASVIKTALPLPGPALGNSSFPQEAYFEITILSSSSSQEDDRDTFGNRRKSMTEGEKAKLIQDRSKSKAKANSESLIHELRFGGKEEGKGEAITMSVGLTRGGSLPLKLPGSFPGSIGFNSDGSVYLDGIKLIFGSEKEWWGKTEKVIGCGYNPSQRKVFFTVDSERVHAIHCKSDEFGSPLYPTLAANTDATILVNFGQTAFRYAPANPHRTPNPCFVAGHPANSPALGYEDSKELFSMGRIDSLWLSRSGTRSAGHNAGGSNNNNNKALDFDEESEGDLFEIVLDRCGRSPNTVLQ